ncbi:MAG: hypothetical protein QUS14_03065 [Pyrinomonadaceae bacterium]|nr:hypothetical protein [Pyrinomonadaceae bacterium]
MNTRSRQSLIAFVLIACGFVAAYFLSGYVAANRTTLPEEFADSDLAVQGGKLKGWALGAEGLLADWYWMWSLQYMGTKIVNAKQEELNLDDLSSLDPRLLYPLLDNTTDLDPQFMPAYSYGASVLPAIDKEKAIALTEKGIERNPDAWRLYQYLGFIYWRLENYEKAAEVYEDGSKIAGAPLFMRQMTAAMRSRGGSRETARQMYRQMLDEAEDQQSRSNAERRLMELDALDDLDAINQVLNSARETSGSCPESLAAIFRDLSKVKLPNGRQFRIDARNNIVDPLGYPYTFERHNCSARLNLESKIPRS